MKNKIKVHIHIYDSTIIKVGERLEELSNKHNILDYKIIEHSGQNFILIVRYTEEGDL